MAYWLICLVLDFFLAVFALIFSIIFLIIAFKEGVSFGIPILIAAIVLLCINIAGAIWQEKGKSEAKKNAIFMKIIVFLFTLAVMFLSRPNEDDYGATIFFGTSGLILTIVFLIKLYRQEKKNASGGTNESGRLCELPADASGSKEEHFGSGEDREAGEAAENETEESSGKKAFGGGKISGQLDDDSPLGRKPAYCQDIGNITKS